MNQERIIKAEIFVHWLHYRLNKDEYGIFELIHHGVKIVELVRELKRLQNERSGSS